MKNLLLVALLGIMIACTAPATEEAPAEPQPIEIADAKYVDLAKAGIPALTSKDIDSFVANIADDGIYVFNSGDSLIGKAAIQDYWLNRMEVITSLEISNDSWLSLKVNESENVPTGNWVLAWFDASASYTTGKSMSQNVHTVYHFNENDQIDVVIQYIDRLPIMMAQSSD